MDEDDLFWSNADNLRKLDDLCASYRGQQNASVTVGSTLSSTDYFQGLDLDKLERNAIAQAAEHRASEQRAEGISEITDEHLSREKLNRALVKTGLSLPGRIIKMLKPFQRCGVADMLMMQGRCLLYDDMGLGKTLQALTVAHAYEAEWPLLIVVPASLREVWVSEIERWLPSVRMEDLLVIMGADDVPENPGNYRVCIVSYSLLKTNLTVFEAVQYKVILCDEAHSTKTFDSQSSLAVSRITRAAERVLMITGSPMLARPHEIFTQLQAVLRKEDKMKLVEGWGAGLRGRVISALRYQIEEWQLRKNQSSVQKEAKKCYKRLWNQYLCQQKIPAYINLEKNTRNRLFSKYQPFLRDKDNGNGRGKRNAVDLVNRLYSACGKLDPMFGKIRLEAVWDAHQFGMLFCEGLYESKMSGSTRGGMIWKYPSLTTSPDMLLKWRAIVLSKYVIRRHKGDVLSLLPKGRKLCMLSSDVIEAANAADRDCYFVGTAEDGEEDVDCLLKISEEEEESGARRVVDTLLADDGLMNVGDSAACERRIKNIVREIREIALDKANAVGEHIITMLEQTEHEQFIVFAHHHNVHNTLVRAMLRKQSSVPPDQQHKYTFALLTGKNSVEDRVEIVRRFQGPASSNRPRVLFLSLLAMGQGVTLTNATTVIIAELDWSPLRLLQAEDRVHRLGQNRPVVVHYMIAAGTKEEDLYGILCARMDSVNCVLEKRQKSRRSLLASPPVINTIAAKSLSSPGSIDVNAARPTLITQTTVRNHGHTTHNSTGKQTCDTDKTIHSTSYGNVCQNLGADASENASAAALAVISRASSSSSVENVKLDNARPRTMMNPPSRLPHLLSSTIKKSEMDSGHNGSTQTSTVSDVCCSQYSTKTIHSASCPTPHHYCSSSSMQSFNTAVRPIRELSFHPRRPCPDSELFFKYNFVSGRVHIYQKLKGGDVVSTHHENMKNVTSEKSSPTAKVTAGSNSTEETKVKYEHAGANFLPLELKAVSEQWRRFYTVKGESKPCKADLKRLPYCLRAWGTRASSSALAFVAEFAQLNARERTLIREHQKYPCNYASSPCVPTSSSSSSAQRVLSPAVQIAPYRSPLAQLVKKLEAESKQRCSENHVTSYQRTSTALQQVHYSASAKHGDGSYVVRTVRYSCRSNVFENSTFVQAFVFRNVSSEQNCIDGIGGIPLCMFCATPMRDATYRAQPQVSSDGNDTSAAIIEINGSRRILFCQDLCKTRWTLKCQQSRARQLVAARDRGVCAQCMVDARQMYERARLYRHYSNGEVNGASTLPNRKTQIVCRGEICTHLSTDSISAEKYATQHWPEKKMWTCSFPQPVESKIKYDYQWDGARKTYHRLLALPARRLREGLFWQADHTLAVGDGGGLAEDISMFQTLCTLCHQQKTKREMTRRRAKQRCVKEKSQDDASLPHLLFQPSCPRCNRIFCTWEELGRHRKKCDNEVRRVEAELDAALKFDGDDNNDSEYASSVEEEQSTQTVRCKRLRPGASRDLSHSKRRKVIDSGDGSNGDV